MPTDFTPQTDIQDAQDLANHLAVRTKRVDIGSIDKAFASALGLISGKESFKIPFANLRARIRMSILYFLANESNYLVAGTGDRSEDLIGYFTKYGDGGVDLLPISHLYKTQVRKLAEFLGIPPRIANKPSSPQLYPGHMATDEIPADYDLLDRVEKMLFDDKLSPIEVSLKCHVKKELVDKIVQRHASSSHKRLYPPMLREW
jgi:NAD+ synthase